MYENISYELILQRMIERARAAIPNIDIREGSVLYNALAPAALELQLMYIELNHILNETFADTADRNNLIKRCAERGIYPEEATKAIRQGEFNMDIPIGARFSLNELNYITKSRKSAGIYQMECEVAGEIGNVESGTLIPIDYIDGLTKAQLTDVLIPGEDEEETEHLRKRYFDSLDSQAFGGNKQDYKEKVSKISGIGGIKVYRVWNGGVLPAVLNNPPTELSNWLNSFSVPDDIKSWILYALNAALNNWLTVGGVVKLVILDSQYKKPSQTLIDTVQTAIDPVQNQGEGVGIAPIGHIVTVLGVDETTVDISTHITFRSGWDWTTVLPYAQEVIDRYFEELSRDWANEDGLVVRISQIETRLLGLDGVLDIQNTSLNGGQQNLIIDSDNIPVRGNVENG